MPLIIYHQLSLFDALIHRNSLIDAVLITSVVNERFSLGSRCNSSWCPLIGIDNLWKNTIAVHESLDGIISYITHRLNTSDSPNDRLMIDLMFIGVGPGVQFVMRSQIVQKIALKRTRRRRRLLDGPERKCSTLPGTRCVVYLRCCRWSRSSFSFSISHV